MARASDEWVMAAVDRFERPLIAYARRMAGRSEVALDIVQETFLRLCGQERERIEPRLAEWLFTVCRNLVVDHLRKEQRMIPTDAIAFDQRSRVIDSETSESVDESDAESLAAMLARLSEREQEIIRLKFQNQLSYREIAAITALSVANVGFILHTALKRLRACAARTAVTPS